MSEFGCRHNWSTTHALNLSAHGSFVSGVEAEFAMTHKTAANFMNVAAKFGAKVEAISTFGPTALNELASSTADVARVPELEQILQGPTVGMPPSGGLLCSRSKPAATSTD